MRGLGRGALHFASRGVQSARMLVRFLACQPIEAPWLTDLQLRGGEWRRPISNQWKHSTDLDN